ncbi:MAG: EF-Tu/IF-2/RF-3 family GTPase [Kofleriaceae bacterium]
MLRGAALLVLITACGGAPAPTPVTPPAPPTATPAPTPAPRPRAEVLLPVEDVFSITGRGTVVTGRLERGPLTVGTSLELVGAGAPRAVVARGVEMFRKVLDRAEAGDNVGVVLEGVERADVVAGDVLATPGALWSTDRVTGTLTLDAGDPSAPTTLLDGAAVQVRAWGAPRAATVALPAGGALAPGATAEATVILTTPIAVEAGLALVVTAGERALGTLVVAP